MKTIRLIPTLILLITMLFVVRCSEDEKPLVKLTGKITYTDPSGQSANAAGAVVYLAAGTVATTTYEQSTTADANGLYTFSNLPANSYYINSVYKTDNKNLTARLDGLTFTTTEGAIVTVADVDVTQDLALVSVGQSTANIEKMIVDYKWSGTAYTNLPKGSWQYDGTHSPVAFEFSYRGQEADFVGAIPQLSKFNVNFDPASLASSTIDVEADMASINTRAPGGRDNTTTIAINPVFSPTTLFTKFGCIMGTFGIAADGGTPTEAVPLPITADADRYAQFKSTSITKYGDGYIAKGDLKFHGFSVPIELMFRVVPKWLDAPVTGTANGRTYSGFEGKFLMAPKKDFNILSSSINDAILRIQISTVLYKEPA